jgi:hypothetical protein
MILNRSCNGGFFMCAFSQTACPEFSRYMAEFRNRFRFALDQNKWYLSERAKRDVGIHAATEDFLNHHFDRFAEEVRARFCQEECGLHAACPLAAFTRSLPATAKTLERHLSLNQATPVPAKP